MNRHVDKLWIEEGRGADRGVCSPNSAVGSRQAARAIRALGFSGCLLGAESLGSLESWVPRVLGREGFKGLTARGSGEETVEAVGAAERKQLLEDELRSRNPKRRTARKGAQSPDRSAPNERGCFKQQSERGSSSKRVALAKRATSNESGLQRIRSRTWR